MADGLSVQHISNSILHDISFHIQTGQLATLVGTTGAGKTTILRAIAGLSSIAHGQVFLHHQDITNLPSYQRKVAMLFQNHVLFPQRTVKENIAFGLQRQKISKQLMLMRIQEIAEIVGVTDLLHRYPETLSGGERQRTALAQILVLHPQALLLDEPLTHLDLPTQAQLRQIIRKIPQTLQIPVLVVTHHPYETLEMSDWLGVLDQGHLLQWDTPANIAQNPYDMMVKYLIGIP